jgi:hypothetical protein
MSRETAVDQTAENRCDLIDIVDPSVKFQFRVSVDSAAQEGQNSRNGGNVYANPAT